ncbi:hypothetical protein IF1G_00337 [Cordyceps javanica]|uniref:Uncharacterized protein n=1 Tax=Cordyceps javanica TaxID=43265 RepID=A0A545VFB9_9HYPO|nr:hypothetical protein IF1G_00337 [Cordyceps javanica]
MTQGTGNNISARLHHRWPFKEGAPHSHRPGLQAQAISVPIASYLKRAPSRCHDHLEPVGEGFVYLGR